MISILDRKTDAMIGWISRVITDSHQDSIKNEEIYNCTISRTEPYASLMSKRERIIIQSEEGDYREFVVQSTRESTVSNSKEVYCTGSFIDLNKLKLIEPQVLEGQTAYTAASFALSGIKEWELGIVEYGDAFDWVIEAHLKGYDALRQISLLSELELRFRITTDGSNVTGRYVDFIKRRGINRGKEIVFGKDLMGITRRINSERIVTSLKVIAPDKSDGSSTKVTVLNDAAFQNWNHKGEHLIDVYEPDVDPDISVVELTKIGNKELQKRIDAVVEYDIESVSLDHVLGYEHEIVRMGDTAYIKDEYFNPPLYLNARAIFIDRSVFYKAHKKYKLGEVIEYKKEDIMKTWRGLQKIYGAKIISSPTPPPGRKDVLWIKTGGAVEIAHRWDSILNKWLPINGSMTWIMYGEDENGLNMSADATGKTYIGFAYNQTEAEPSMDPLDYSWSLFQGPQGVKGPTGPNGEPTFTWIKYATSITGANMDDNPTDKSYIGIAYNQPSQTESSDPAVYTWALFKGPKGEPGYTPVKGTDYFDGEKGTTGTSSYLWVRYSQNINGSGMVTSPTDAKYVGIATTTTAVAPTGYTSYSWSLIKGTDGIEGEPGTDGNTSYLHIKYSNDGGSTLTANAGETVGDWIGTYVDFTATDSTTTSSYTWNKVKGEKGNDGYTPVKGTDYFDGDKGQDGTSSYLWVRYSQNINGNPMTTSPTNALYVGIATTTTSVAPTGYASYSWSLIKGTDGIEGEPGTDGKTSYLHIKYSNDGGVTLTANSGETVGDWIGTYVDFVSTDSTSVSAYTWNKVKGEKGNDGYTPVKGTDYFDGEKGTTGTSSYLWVRYSQNADGSGMVTSPTNAKYVGIATTTTATAPTINTTYAWSLIKGTDGIEGEPGTDGNTSYLHIKYSDNGTTFTANNGETVGAYIGTYVDFISADSLTFAAYTWNKVKGETGLPGKGITSIVEQYYLSTSATTQVGGAWSTTVPAWVDGRYMWTRSVITYTDSSSTTTVPVNVTGGKGTTGGTGTPGVGITNIDVMYYLSTSATSLVGGAWTTTAPAWVDGKYMWSKTVTTYTNATTDESTPANITGSKGSTGGTGAPGKGVTSIIEEYYYSTSATTQTGGAWSTTVPAWVDGKYVWTRAKTTFTDATTSYTSPVNVTGQKGTNGVTTYTWVKYADDVNGAGIADVPTGKRFMGIAVNKTTTTESDTASDYNWSPLYDNVVVGGRNLFEGSAKLSVYSGTATNSEHGYVASIQHALDKLDLNEEMTISIDVDMAKAGSLMVYNSNADGEFVFSPSKSFSVVAGKQRLSLTARKVANSGTIGSPGNTKIELYSTYGTANWWTASKLKIERGNVATDWTEAPEDITKYVDDVVVGGRNYLRRLGGGTYDVTRIYGTDENITEETIINGKKWLRIKTAGMLRLQNVNIEPNTEYAYSFDAFHEAISTNVTMTPYFTSGSYGAMYVTIPTSPKRVSGTFISKPDATFDILHISGLTVGTHIADLKLEMGNKASDWTPAPEDVVEAIEAAEAAAKAHSDITPVSGGKVFNNPSSGSYYFGAAISGMLAITTPIMNGMMASVHITGYNYITNKSTIDVTVSFYAYNASAFLAHSFVSRGDFPITRVRMGRNASGQAVILLGDTTTSWSYPAVQVSSAKLTYGYPPDSHLSGWSTLMTTSITAYTALTELGGMDIMTGVGAAQATADGKNTVFYSNLPPSTVGRKAGDTWFDTDDGNKMYGFNGGWVAEQFGVNAIQDLAINNAKIANGTIESAKIVSLDAAKITALSLSAIIANLGTVTAGILRNVSGSNIIDMNSGIISFGSGNFTVNGSVVRFKGDLVSGTDDTRGLRITGSGEVRAFDPEYTNGRKLFDITDTLPIILDGNQSGGSVNPKNFAKIYTRTFNVSIPAASYTTGSRITISHAIADYTEVAIANVMTVQLAVASKEWRCYETDSTSRVYGGGDLSSINLSVSPNFAYTSGGTTIQVTMLIVGMR